MFAYLKHENGDQYNQNDKIIVNRESILIL